MRNSAVQRKNSDQSIGSSSRDESTPAPSVDSANESIVCFDSGRLSAIGADLDSIAALRRHSLDRIVSTLDVSQNGLASTSGLEYFPRLTTLVLDNNKLTSLDGLPVLRELTTLWANNNQLADLDAVLNELVKKAPALRYLSLLGNPAARSALLGASSEETERYRAYIIYRLPSLQLLDAMPVSAGERKVAKERGKFLRVTRPAAVTAAPSQPNKVYAPGAKHADRVGKHSSYFGKQRRHYSGKYSEGNRFIRDAEL